MSMSHPPGHRAALPRSVARALTLAGAAAGVWLLGQATASAEEPVQQPLLAVEVGLAPVDQLVAPGAAPVEALAPVVSAVRTPGVPVVPAATSKVAEAAAPVARAAAPVAVRLAPVHEVIPPVVGSDLAPTEQVSTVVEQAAPPAVEQAVEPAVDQARQPVMAPVVPVPASVVPAAPFRSAAEGTRPRAGVDVPAGTPPPLPLPVLPRPASVPAPPSSTTVQAGGSHPLDPQSADLSTGALAVAAALGAVADDARDSAAAAPVEPSCSPD